MFDSPPSCPSPTKIPWSPQAAPHGDLKSFPAPPTPPGTPKNAARLTHMGLQRLPWSHITSLISWKPQEPPQGCPRTLTSPLTAPWGTPKAALVPHHLLGPLEHPEPTPLPKGCPTWALKPRTHDYTKHKLSQCQDLPSLPSWSLFALDQTCTAASPADGPPEQGGKVGWGWEPSTSHSLPMVPSPLPSSAMDSTPAEVAPRLWHWFLLTHQLPSASQAKEPCGAKPTQPSGQGGVGSPWQTSPISRVLRRRKVRVRASAQATAGLWSQGLLLRETPQNGEGVGMGTVSHL